MTRWSKAPDSYGTHDPKAVVEPTEPGWYTYTGGAKSMIFLRHHDWLAGEPCWSVVLDNGSISRCAWGYVEQALSTYDLVRLVPERVELRAMTDRVQVWRGSSGVWWATCGRCQREPVSTDREAIWAYDTWADAQAKADRHVAAHIMAPVLAIWTIADDLDQL